MPQKSLKMTNCDHRWKLINNSMGDMSIPRGTLKWHSWECQLCFEETEEQPDGWEDPREADADCARDKATDDRLTGDA